MAIKYREAEELRRTTRENLTRTPENWMKLSISLDTITSKKRAVHRFRAGGKSSHRRRRLALGRF